MLIHYKKKKKKEINASLLCLLYVKALELTSRVLWTCKLIKKIWLLDLLNMEPMFYIFMIADNAGC